MSVPAELPPIAPLPQGPMLPLPDPALPLPSGEVPADEQSPPPEQPDDLIA